MASSVQETHKSGEKVKVFVTYSTKYREEAVLRMVKFLRTTAGYEVSTRKDNLTGLIDKIDAVVKSINDAHIVLCFLSNAYSECEDCTDEIRYAAEKRKEILPIIIERDIKPTDWLDLILAYKVQIKYLDWESFELASSQISKLIESSASRQRDLLTSSNDFRLVGVPFFAKSEMFQRKPIEGKILSNLEKVAKAKEGGMVVIYGEGGIGKSTQMAGIMYDAERRSFLVNECGINRLIWLNCFQWRNTFNEETFYKKVVALAEEMDTELRFRKDDSATKKFSIMLQFYQKRNLTCVYIFDDIFNGEEIESFIEKHGRISPPVFFVVTRQLTNFYGYGINRSDIQFPELSDIDIIQMLKTTFKLHKWCNEEQFEQLAPLCCGLPLLANLVASRIKHDVKDVQGACQAIVSDLTGELRDKMKTRDKYKSRSELTVFSLLSYSLDQMDARERMSYYSFLIFNPAEPAEIDTLAILWGQDNSERHLTDVKWQCRQFERRCLLRRVNPVPWKILKEDRFLLHQALFEAAVQKASTDFYLSDNMPNDEKLYSIRLKLVLGEMKNKEEFGLAMLVNCVNKDEKFLLERIFLILSAEDIVEAFQKKSNLTNDETFIDFAYERPPFRYAISRKICSSLRNAEYLLQNHPRLLNITTKPHDVTILSNACSEGQLSVVKYLFEKEPQLVNISDSNDSTALHLACHYGNLEVARFLLSEAPQLGKMTDYRGFTALHVAGLSGHLEIVRLLFVKAPELVNITSRSHYTVLQYAAGSGNPDLVKFLYDNAPQLFIGESKCRVTLLHEACHYGDLETVKFLITKVPQQINFTNRNGETILHAAAASRHLDTVQFLVEKQPQLVGKTSNDGRTALHFAIRNLNILKFLITAAPEIVNVQTNSGSTVFHEASEKGILDTVKFLLENQRKLVSISGANGWTVMHHASRGGKLEIVQFLFKNLPQLINSTSKDGLTALHCASEKGNLATVKFLLEKAPELVNFASTNGWTPLHYASVKGHLSVVKLLLEKHPELINSLDDDGTTALHLASGLGCLEVVKELYKHGPQLANNTDRDGRTALQRASRRGKMNVVSFLLENAHGLTAQQTEREISQIEANRQRSSVKCRQQ